MSVPGEALGMGGSVEKMDRGWLIEAGGLRVFLDGVTGEPGPFLVGASSSETGPLSGDFDLAQADGDGAGRVNRGLTELMDPAARSLFSRHTAGAHVEWRVSGEGESSPFIEIERRWDGVSTRLITRWTAAASRLELDFAITGFDGTKTRPELSFSFPLSADPAPRNHDIYNCWAPVSGAPFEGLFGHRVFRYPDYIYKPDSILMGVVSLYKPKADAGFTLMIPPEDACEAEIAIAQREHVASIKFSSPYGEAPLGSLRFRLRFKSHGGCWRPGFKWFVDSYPEYFAVRDRKIFESEGNYVYAYPSASENTVRTWASKMGLKWVEMLFLPGFGRFAPEEETWTVDMFKGWKGAGADAVIENVTYERVADQIRLYHKYGVKVFAYFNLFECEKPLAEAKFKDCVMTDARGRYRQAWTYPDGERSNWCMNPSPELAWGKHIRNQAERLFEKLPELDGLFVDNLLFGLPDFSRSDGVTYLNGKPAFNCALAHERLIRVVAEIAEKHGRALWCNGPNNSRKLSHIGGVMSEGVEAALGKFEYFCVSKPLLLLRSGERALQAALRRGASTAVTPSHYFRATEPDFNDADIGLYAAYLPLLEFLRERVLCLYPRALTLPNVEGTFNALWHSEKMLDGNIFQLKDGNYAVTLLGARRSVTDRNGFSRDIPIKINIPEAAKIENVRVLGAEYRGYVEAPFSIAADGMVLVRIPFHGSASLALVVIGPIDMRGIGETRFNPDEKKTPEGGALQ